METKILGLSDIDLKCAAELIKSGALVAIPTETVYGLGANGLDPAAVGRIFEAKGRPQDNPLILHIENAAQMEHYCVDIPEAAYKLAYAFWPGPLTMILKSADIVPEKTRAGLETVAIRCPASEAARAIIRLAGVPIAAPSANISGRPSPTRLQHVIQDMSGKIEAIVDGGDCRVGLESTIIDLSTGKARLLRLGGLSVRRVEDVIGPVEVPEQPSKGEEPERPIAPGMKYRHYAPKAKVTLISGPIRKAAEYINENAGDDTAVLCTGEEAKYYKPHCIVYGEVSDPDTMAHGLFAALREIDSLGFTRCLARCPEYGDILDAVRNRLEKAAAFDIIEV